MSYLSVRTVRVQLECLNIALSSIWRYCAEYKNKYTNTQMEI